MLKKLRWQFILSAMAAFSIVLISLVAMINLAYSVALTHNQDTLIDFIEENGDRKPMEWREPPQNSGKQKEKPTQFIFEFTPETPFETRYFTITADESGVVSSNMENIARITGNDADYYFSKASETKADRGTLEKYRFKAYSENGKIKYIFMDIYQMQRQQSNLLLISVVLTIFAILATFVLVYFFSKKVIAPTVRSIESQKRFITDASHELKTPITAISAYAEMLLTENEDNEWARGIKKETSRLTELVTDMVELSRWDEERPISKEKFSLSQSLWDIVTPYEKIAESHGKKVCVDIQNDMDIIGDEANLQTAVFTIMDNAIKYSIPGSEILLRAYKKKNSSVIEISNRYSGDKEEDPSRLFDRFYRPDRSRTRSSEASGGNGVGLSIAQAIILSHKGNISASYEGEDIIKFTITLPG